MFEIGGLPFPVWMAQRSITEGSSSGNRKVNGGGNTYVRSDGRSDGQERSMRPNRSAQECSVPENSKNKQVCSNVRRHSRTGITAALGPDGAGERLFPRQKVVLPDLPPSAPPPYSGRSTANPPARGDICPQAEISEEKSKASSLVETTQQASILSRIKDAIPSKGKFETSAEYLSRLRLLGNNIALPKDVARTTFLLPENQGEPVELDYDADRGEWIVPVKPSITLEFYEAESLGSVEFVFDDDVTRSAAVFKMNRDLARQLDKRILACYHCRVETSTAQIETASNLMSQLNKPSLQIKARLLAVKLVRVDSGEIVGSTND